MQFKHNKYGKAITQCKCGALLGDHKCGLRSWCESCKRCLHCKLKEEPWSLKKKPMSPFNGLEAERNRANNGGLHIPKGLVVPVNPQKVEIHNHQAKRVKRHV